MNEGGDLPNRTGPVTLRASRWVALVGAAVLVGGTALFFTVQGRLAQELLAANRKPGYTAEQAQSATTSFLWTLLIVSILLGGLQCWFSWRTGSGRRGFRTAATVVFACTVVFVLAAGGYIQVIAGVILLAGIVLQYVPSSNLYLREGPYSR
jgi:hypothetical protein